MDEWRGEAELPGFRFQPTDEELISFHLKTRVLGQKCGGDVIGVLNIYDYSPNELPGHAILLQLLITPFRTDQNAPVRVAENCENSEVGTCLTSSLIKPNLDDL